MSESAILSIVEELKGLQLGKITQHMYDPTFWLPYIPLKNKTLEMVEPNKKYQFVVSDTIILDPTGTLRQEMNAKGEFTVKDLGDQGAKGSAWEIVLKIEEYKAEAIIRIRAKDVAGSLKVGIYLYKLEYDMGLLQGIGKDPILFAIRTKVRELMDDMQRKLK
jgi:hypothetical protein